MHWVKHYGTQTTIYMNRDQTLPKLGTYLYGSVGNVCGYLN